MGHLNHRQAACERIKNAKRSQINHLSMSAAPLQKIITISFRLCRATGAYKLQANLHAAAVAARLFCARNLLRAQSISFTLHPTIYRTLQIKDSPPPPRTETHERARYFGAPDQGRGATERVAWRL